MPKQLKVLVSGCKFILTEDQYKTDSPNYFTDHIAGHTSRFRGPQIRVSRNAVLFMLIIEYMNGYAILAEDSRLPRGMTRKLALKNLISEAKFYRLGLLEQMLTKQFQRLDFGPSWYVMLSGVSKCLDATKNRILMGALSDGGLGRMGPPFTPVE